MSSSALSTVTTRTSSALSTATAKTSSALSTATAQTSSAFSTATTKLQSTPVKQASQTAAIATDSPGNWKHPKLAEITRRQRRTEFSERNIKTIMFNGLAFIISVVLRQLASS